MAESSKDMRATASVRYDAVGPYLDRDAEREVTGPFVRSVLFELYGSEQCARRGVVETADGTVYTLTIRRWNHADTVSGRQMLATQMRAGSEFGRVARDLVEFEKNYIPGDRIREYRAAAAAL